MNKKCIWALLPALFLYSAANAQSSLETTMRADGKLMVVATVALVTMLSLIAYLFRLENKLKKK